jgi:hypothetical protein
MLLHQRQPLPMLLLVLLLLSIAEHAALGGTPAW